MVASQGRYTVRRFPQRWVSWVPVLAEGRSDMEGKRRKSDPDAPHDNDLDRELDEELENTFPASDPPKVTRVPRRSQITGGDEKEDKEDH